VNFGGFFNQGIEGESKKRSHLAPDKPEIGGRDVEP
jgi:hypothetical protein